MLWALGVLVTQITADKRPMVKLFNVGVGILARRRRGRGAACRPRVRRSARRASCSPWRSPPPPTSSPTSCSPASRVALESSTPVRDHLLQRGTLVAVACFVPFDSLGYLGAVVNRSAPWWTLLLLAVPLATLLVATRAVTRGGENARRLTVLFDAAVRAQTLSDTRQVVDALDRRRPPAAADQPDRGARHAARTARDRRPAAGRPARPLDRRARHRTGARSTMTADQQALKAMVAVSVGRVRAAPADRGHDPPRPPRPADRPAEPWAAARPGRARPADVPPPRHADRAAVRGPRRLQAGQRPVRPRGRRRGAGRRRAAADELRAAERHRRPARRRRVRAAARGRATRPRSAPPASGS